MNDTPNDKPEDNDTPEAGEPRRLSSEEIDVTRDLNEAQSDFMSQPSDAIFGAQGAGPPQQVGDVLQIGPYAIIGSPAPTPPGGKPKTHIDGGEGRIYLAQHIGDKTTVVLKTPLPQYASDPVRCARLIREAEQLRNMDHPGIVKIHEINPDSAPPYYAMEYLSGGDLSSMMKKGKPLPKDKVLSLAIPLADAVRYVNDDLGISHRDIKPINVMLDDKGNPYFIDFGLSRDNTGDEVSITDHRTPNNNRFKVGTARYMAPELFDGKAGNAQTDIYAFGIMLYELATGGRPYEASDYQSINKMKRLVDPDLPTQVYPEIDKYLAAVIEHAVARRAKDRYATMEDLHEDLELIRDGVAPIHATPLGAVSDRAEDANEGAAPRKKSRVGLLVATAVLLAAIGGGIGIAMTQNGGVSDGDEVALVNDDASNTQSEGEGDPNSGTNNAGNASSGTNNTDQGTLDPVDEVLKTLPKDISDLANPTRTDEHQGVDTNTPTIEKPIPSLPGTNAKDTTTPTTLTPQFAELYQSITAEFARTDTLQRDTEIAKKVIEMSNAQPEDKPDAAVTQSYGQWLHRAATTGMPNTLAALIKNAKAFGASSGVLDDNGYTWLQSAVRSPDNKAFARQFAAWFKANQIDAAVLEDASIGTRPPLKEARFLARADWAKALVEAGKQDAE